MNFGFCIASVGSGIILTGRDVWVKVEMTNSVHCLKSKINRFDPICVSYLGCAVVTCLQVRFSTKHFIKPCRPMAISTGTLALPFAVVES